VKERQEAFFSNLTLVRSEVEQAILPVDWLSSQSSRMQGGSGDEWPPHS
jgi:hypothetical protein